MKQAKNQDQSDWHVSKDVGKFQEHEKEKCRGIIKEKPFAEEPIRKFHQSINRHKKNSMLIPTLKIENDLATYRRTIAEALNKQSNLCVYVRKHDQLYRQSDESLSVVAKHHVHHRGDIDSVQQRHIRKTSGPDLIPIPFLVEG